MFRFLSEAENRSPCRTASACYAVSFKPKSEALCILSDCNLATLATFAALLPALFRLKLSVGSRVRINLSINSYSGPTAGLIWCLLNPLLAKRT